MTGNQDTLGSWICFGTVALICAGYIGYYTGRALAARRATAALVATEPTPIFDATVAWEQQAASRLRDV